MAGDLICNSRGGSGLNYDNAQEASAWRSGHCDIVTQVLSDRILVIGGNKGNGSVLETRRWLDSNGFFDVARNNRELQAILGNSSRDAYFGIMSIWG